MDKLYIFLLICIIEMLYLVYCKQTGLNHTVCVYLHGIIFLPINLQRLNLPTDKLNIEISVYLSLICQDQTCFEKQHHTHT